MGKGHQGTCVKDPWTKPKGGRLRVRVGGMEESYDRKMETTLLE